MFDLWAIQLTTAARSWHWQRRVPPPTEDRQVQLHGDVQCHVPRQRRAHLHFDSELSMSDNRSEVCVRCEFEHIQSTNPATGIHRKLCAAPGSDSKAWLVMDNAFMGGAGVELSEG